MRSLYKSDIYGTFLNRLFRYSRYFLEYALKYLDNYLESWFKPSHTAGGVARCQTYLFPMRSPGSHPPFRGFPLYTCSCSAVISLNNVQIPDSFERQANWIVID